MDRLSFYISNKQQHTATFIIKIIKMLILQKDYITIDLEKVGGREMCDSSSMGDIYGLEFTIQCNGKIKRHTTTFQTKITEVGTGGTNEEFKKSYEYLDVMDWLGIHSSIELLDSLGYELDVLELQNIISQKLKDIYSK